MSTDKKMELQVLQNEHKFSWNFEDVKADLADYTERYVGLVVTEDNLKEMEATGREVASLRTKVEKFRKIVKADMEKPYIDFESQINDLKKIIAGVEVPIKDQLDQYEQNRITLEKNELIKYAAETAKSIGLREENAHISILAKWTNRTAKKNETRQEICTELDRMLQQQINEDNAIAIKKQKDELIVQLCVSVSEKYSLTTQIKPNEVAHLTYNAGIADINGIIEAECKRRADVELEAARVAALAATPVAEPTKHTEEIRSEQPSISRRRKTVQQKEPRYNITLRFTDIAVSEVQELCAYIKANGVTFEIVEKVRAKQ